MLSIERHVIDGLKLLLREHAKQGTATHAEANRILDGIESAEAEHVTKVPSIEDKSRELLVEQMNPAKEDPAPAAPPTPSIVEKIVKPIGGKVIK